MVVFYGYTQLWWIIRQYEKIGNLCFIRFSIPIMPRKMDCAQRDMDYGRIECEA